MFKILSKYEVMIPEEDEVKLELLPHTWVTFQQCLIDSTAMLKKHKVQYICMPCHIYSAYIIIYLILWPI